jgi:DNA-binding NarL/FixJ family response regulator/two-component sensor histidine kinase
MKALRILNLEDSPLDAELLHATLTDGGVECEILRVQTRADFTAALEGGDFDLVLADYSLPSFDGLSALKVAQEIGPGIPFVLVSGAVGEEVAIEALKSGATDYVLKQRLERLVPAVRRALREAEERAERKRAEETLETQARQQAAVADLGRRAITEPTLSALMDKAVEVVAHTLRVRYCEVLELLPEGDALLLRAGVGWKEGLVGRTTLGVGLDSQAGYTLVSRESILVEDLREEKRFSGPPLLHEHGVVSGMSVVIHGQGKSYGVLGAHTDSRRAFTEDDANFLQAVANVIATAVDRKEAEEALLEVGEAERRKMAHNLHDGALQDLTYAVAEVQLVQAISKDPELAPRLQRVVEALVRMGRELRGIVYDLRLEEERDKPLPELLESLVEMNRRMTPDRNIRLDVQDGFASDSLGQGGTQLLRILQEALTNVHKHADARNVLVRLGGNGDEIWVEVTDDGRGFDPETIPGVGLRSMRERARALGGNLEIESEPAKGTKVRFQVALKRDEEPRLEKAIRVLLVEDHSSFRQATASVFEREPGFEVVGQAGSLAEARRLLEGVDVAVVDLGLPDGYGGELIKELREKNPQAQTLVLSATLDRAEMARAVEAGAAGFLHKSAGMVEVMEAIRRLRAGETLLPVEEVVELLRFAGSRREHEHEARLAIAQLTPREREVLQALAEGLDGKEIAEQLGISDKTERNHMASILAKLGVHSRLQALVFALRHNVV